MKKLLTLISAVVMTVALSGFAQDASRSGLATGSKGSAKQEKQSGITGTHPSQSGRTGTTVGQETRQSRGHRDTRPGVSSQSTPSHSTAKSTNSNSGHSGGGSTPKPQGK